MQTVLRAYGRRARLIDLAMARVTTEIGAGLDRAEPGDVDASVATWFDHYEQYADVVRTRHRRRVERQFRPQLGAVPAAERATLVDALVCACDVYTWKLLRRDLGRSRARAEATVRLTVRGLLSGD